MKKLLKRIKDFRQMFYLKQTWMLAHICVGAPQSTTRTTKGYNWNEFDYIIARYSEPGRYYHGLAHLEHGLKFLEICFKRGLISRRDFGLLLFTYFYHDVIMHFGRKDNELESAHRLGEFMIAAGFMWDHDTKRMQNLLMGTRDHQNPKDMDDLPLEDPLWPILNDADLLVFSAPFNIYDKYRENIWLEYSAICDRPTFVAGRLAFLKNFKKKTLFRTKGMAKRGEAIAAQNIDDEILFLEIEAL